MLLAIDFSLFIDIAALIVFSSSRIAFSTVVSFVTCRLVMPSLNECRLFSTVAHLGVLCCMS